MKCQEATSLVERLVDGEASVEEKARAEAHLGGCETCRAHYSFLRSIAETRGKQPPPEPPEAYWGSMTRNILARIEEDNIKESRSGRRTSRGPAALGGTAMRFVGLAAGVVLAVAVVWNVMFRGADAPSSSQADSPIAASPSIAAPSAEDEETLAPPATRAQSMPRAAGRADTEFRDEPSEGTAQKARSGPKPRMVVDESSEDAAEAPEEARFERFASEPRRAPSPSPLPLQTTEGTGAGEEATARLGSASNRVPSPAEAQSQPDCERFREALRSAGDGEEAIDLAFQLARCEIARYESEPSEEARARAIAEAEAFLRREPEGDRAEEMRSALSRVYR